MPGLLDLPRDYLIAQLGAWRTGARHAAAPDCMSEVARRLSPEDLLAVAAWLSAQTVPRPMRPAPAPDRPAPLRCGSAGHPQ
jgi:cytochrome c553